MVKKKKKMGMLFLPRWSLRTVTYVDLLKKGINQSTLSRTVVMFYIIKFVFKKNYPQIANDYPAIICTIVHIVPYFCIWVRGPLKIQYSIFVIRLQEGKRGSILLYPGGVPLTLILTAVFCLSAKVTFESSQAYS